MKKGLLCPLCGKWESWEEVRVTNSWLEFFKEYNSYGAREGGDIEEVVNVYDFEHVKTEHKCNFETRNYRAEEFEVEVLDDGTVNFVGEYWKRIKKLSERMRIYLIQNDDGKTTYFAVPADRKILGIVLGKNFPGKPLPFAETNLPHKTAFVDRKGRIVAEE